ncbi:MAG: methyltransferase domain-containing protein [Gammaproteobacteria bacterium]|nr:methyltransferase domain-containing protein [Gammaproteobacteria bacterium]
MNQSSLDWFLAEEQARLEEVASHFFGYYLLILSNSDVYPRIECPISTHIVVKQMAENLKFQQAIVADWTELPFAPGSIDAMILPHVMDCYKNTSGLLNEVALLLRHDGHVVLTGFNPLRIKARRLAKRYHKQGLRLCLCSTVIKALTQAGFEIVTVKRFGFVALKNKAMEKWLNRVLDSVLPSMGCAYVIVAQKKVLAPIAELPNWTSSLLQSEKVVISSCRVQSNDR